VKLARLQLIYKKTNIVIYLQDEPEDISELTNKAILVNDNHSELRVTSAREGFELTSIVSY
jgi:hypothetical protein